MDTSAVPYNPLLDVQSFQKEAIIAIGPSFIGWSLQLLISGATLHAATEHLNPKTSVFDGRTRMVTWAVCTLNFVVVAFTFYEVFFWGSIQPTSLDALFQFTTIDAIVSIPTGLLAAIVQAFFANRAWKVVKKNKLFVLVVGIGWTCALAGSIAVAAESLRPQDDELAYFNVLVVTQVWLWSSAFVDAVISTVLVSSLYRYKEGWNSRSNDTFAWLMQLAFQTVALTTVFVLAASITALVTYKYASSSVYYALQYPIPALYAFSFIWSLDTVAIARKRQQLPTNVNMSSSRCSTCQNQNFGIWPYACGPEQVVLPTLQQALTRHEEPGNQTSDSQLSLSAFLKPIHHACARSKAGKGSLSVKIDNVVANLPPSPDPSTIQVEVETVHRIEIATPGITINRTGSAYFTPS